MSIYGIIISVAILICVLLGEKKVSKEKLSFFWNLSLITIISGLIGARVYHVIDLWSYYSINPIRVLYFWNGGLGIWGGLIGGFIGSYAYIALKREKLIYWLDLIASVVPLGQAVGRWGNYFNQENFGKPTSLPWGININAYPDLKFHPLFLYESILDLILFFILTKFKLGTGKVIAFYLLGYSIIRFLLEFIKTDPWEIYGVNVAQLVSVTVTLACAIYLIRPRRFQSKN